MIVEFFLRSRGREQEEWPDRQGLIYQPIRLIRAIDEVRRYFAEQEAQG